MQSLTVNPQHHGKRLDRFLVEQFKISRKKAKQMIDQGKIFIGPKKIIIASWEVQSGEVVEVRDPKEAKLPRRRLASDGTTRGRYLKIHYEDKDILVVEKPAGVSCERTPQTLSSTLVDDINDYLRRAHSDRPYPYLGLMHRLDRETSGLMVYTLSKQANRLAKEFKSHRIVRRYLALVEGQIKKAQGRIDKPLKKDPSSQGKKMVSFRAKRGNRQGRAVTDYLVQRRYGKVTLVEARLLTGRTHQVRVHFANLGHPILGDRLYGSRVKVPRHLLHASYLEFIHPVSKKKMKFKSPLPNDFKKALEKFGSR